MYSERRSIGLASALTLLLAACGGSPPADEPTPIGPNLRSAQVMVLPVQASPAGVSRELAAALDAEVEYWAREQAPELPWTFPPELERTLERSPTLDVPLHALPLGALGSSGVPFVQDPLLGQLRRLGAVVDRRLALVPLEAILVNDTAGGEPRLRLRLVLVDTMGGRILWRGMVEGGPAAAPRALAAATGRAVARALIR